MKYLAIVMGFGKCVKALLACEGRLSHLGLDKAPALSTLSDANNSRSFLVFAMIYEELLKQYHSFIPAFAGRQVGQPVKRIKHKKLKSN